jgi:glutamate synthase domain-containing protein 1
MENVNQSTAIVGTGKQLNIHTKGKEMLGKLTNALGSLQSTLDQFQELTEGKLEQIADQYYEKTEAFDALKTELAETERSARVELTIRMREDAIAEMNRIAAENGRTVITTEELEALRTSLGEAQKDNQAAIEEAVSAEKRSAAISANAQIAAAKSEHAVASATYIATIDSLINQLEASRNEANNLRVMLADAQTNAVKIAEAGKSNITVDNGSGRK